MQNRKQIICVMLWIDCLRRNVDWKESGWFITYWSTCSLWIIAIVRYPLETAGSNWRDCGLTNSQTFQSTQIENRLMNGHGQLVDIPNILKQTGDCGNGQCKHIKGNTLSTIDVTSFDWLLVNIPMPSFWHQIHINPTLHRHLCLIHRPLCLFHSNGGDPEIEPIETVREREDNSLANLLL